MAIEALLGAALTFSKYSVISDISLESGQKLLSKDSIEGAKESRMLSHWVNPGETIIFEAYGTKKKYQCCEGRQPSERDDTHCRPF